MTCNEPTSYLSSYHGSFINPNNDYVCFCLLNICSTAAVLRRIHRYDKFCWNIFKFLHSMLEQRLTFVLKLLQQAEIKWFYLYCIFPPQNNLSHCSHEIEILFSAWLKWNGNKFQSIRLFNKFLYIWPYMTLFNASLYVNLYVSL